jgi:serine/threonine protein kinase
LSAAAVIHKSGLVHLDIKPANCLNIGSAEPLRHAPRTKLIDFGIARLTSGLTQAPAIGTPAYWAPEQAGASSVDERTDVYSIGATFYELLTGKPPNTAKRRTPSDCNPGAGIPADLDRIVMQALETEPSQRYPDAGSFQQSLVAVLGEGATTRTLPSPMVRPESAPSVSVEVDDQPANGQLSRLRRKVETFWVNGVLGASSDAIALAVQERTLEHELIAGLASTLESTQPIPVPPNCSMYDVFEEHGRTLLITGGPGSGKTTQMLLLARDLLNRGPRSAPVIFTLSTWQQGALSQTGWCPSSIRNTRFLARSARPGSPKGASCRCSMGSTR